jgi:DNA invertase Pin-like site-specific DNA recombinase
LYLDQQNIDSTTPVGKLLFQITSTFAEFERSMIRARVNPGLKCAKDQIKQKGHFVTKHGEIKKRLGRQVQIQSASEDRQGCWPRYRHGRQAQA